MTLLDPEKLHWQKSPKDLATQLHNLMH